MHPSLVRCDRTCSTAGQNIITTSYRGGHMMYTMKSELIKLTDDVKKFYDGFGS